MTTNLTPLPGGSKGELTWTFDLEGIVEMYKSYEVSGKRGTRGNEHDTNAGNHKTVFQTINVKKSNDAVY